MSTEIDEPKIIERNFRKPDGGFYKHLIVGVDVFGLDVESGDMRMLKPYDTEQDLLWAEKEGHVPKSKRKKSDLKKGDGGVKRRRKR